MVVMQSSIDSQSIMPKKRASGYTFAQALKDKYVEQEEFDNRLTLPKDKNISTEIMFIGFGKITAIQKQLKHLTTIDLSSRSIDLAGQLSDLDGCLVQIKMLNLADNFLPWREIISVLEHLPNLMELIISGNNIHPDEDIYNLTTSLRRKLTSLTVGRVYMSWSDILRMISCIWTRVEQLDLWDNRLTNSDMKSVREASDLLNQLRSLKLSNNCFTDISWLAQVDPLTSLTELDLSRCQLQSIDINSAIAKQLRNLVHLNISYNNIDSWKSISTLHELDSLKNLMCIENPVYITEKFAKFLTIGRLGRLQVLNREEITNGQRRDSEIFYLRKAFPEFESSGDGKTDEFMQLHPRYVELIETYGLPEDLRKQRVIEKYINIELCHGEKSITKKLPCDMRIANVKMLCKKLFKLRLSSDLEITYSEAQQSGADLRYLLDKDGQTLHFFSVKSGHRLIIDEIE